MPEEPTIKDLHDAFLRTYNHAYKIGCRTEARHAYNRVLELQYTEPTPEDDVVGPIIATITIDLYSVIQEHKA